MSQYKCIAREGMKITAPVMIEATSPKSAVYKLARQLGYYGRRLYCGKLFDYISQTYEFDGSVPCCVAVYLSDRVLYYNVKE